MIYLNGNKLPIEKFGAGEFKFEDIPFSTSEYDKVFDIRWHFESNEEIFYIYALKRHLDTEFPSFCKNLRMWYIPYARMDRVKSENDVFSLKWFAEIINSMKFDAVYVADPHSNVSCALIERLKYVNIKSYFGNLKCEEFNQKFEDFVIAFPDYSAYKRYSEFFPENRMIYFEKNRNWKTHKIEGMRINMNGFSVDEISNKNILIVDDILSYGGTMYGCVKSIFDNIKNPLSIYTYATHTENVVTEGKFYNEMLKTGIVSKHFTLKTIYNLNVPEIKIIY